MDSYGHEAGRQREFDMSFPWEKRAEKRKNEEKGERKVRRQNTALQPSRHWLVNFLPIFVGQSFSLLSSAIVQFALIWWLTEKSGDSASVLAMAALLGQLPQIIIGPFAGVLVDRWNRKTVMICADGFIALSTLVLAILLRMGNDSIGAILVILVLRSAGSAFHWPAMEASTAMMVPDQHLTRVTGFNTVLYSVTSIAGPAMGALLLGFWPMEWVLILDVAGAMIANILLAFVKIPRPIRKDLHQPHLWRELKEGFQGLYALKGLFLLTIACTIGAVFDTPPGSLTPLLVKTHFTMDRWGYGAAQMALGIGTFSGSLIMGIWGGFRKRVRSILLAYLLMGSVYLLVGLLPPSAFTVAVIAMVPLGISGGLFYGAYMATMQSYVPYHLQGRVMSVVQSLLWVAGPIGLAIAGPVADHIGIHWVYIGAGVGILLITLYILQNKTIWCFEDMTVRNQDNSSSQSDERR